MAGMGPPLVSVRDLHHVYRPGTPQETAALQGVDLDIAPGECVALIGGNGSGKSTLAKHLNALLLPTRGRVLVDGIDTRDPEGAWQVRQRVGMVFEHPDNQIVAAMVEEDVAFGCENLGLPPAEIQARVDAALASVGLTAERRAPPHQLSGGQKQRVAIAGILAMRPRCLVLDEATSMLDPRGRREVMEAALALCRRQGLAVVLITHAMEEAAQADRVLVMAAGRIAFQGPPAEVFGRERDLRRLRLEPPELALLARGLARDGIPVPPHVLTLDALVEALAPRR
jgi:energy-coupling factor transport system ATP-binding protein